MRAKKPVNKFHYDLPLYQNKLRRIGKDQGLRSELLLELGNSRLRVEVGEGPPLEG